MLEAIDLACQRGERTLFSHLKFTLDAGELLFVQGSNGSGKTSLLRMVCGLMAPAWGEIRWRGERIDEERQAFHTEMAYFGHAPAIKEDLTALENLDFACRLAGHPVALAAALGALERLGVGHCRDLPVRVLSQGQRRRVALARIPLSPAALWILDEPLTALDVSAAQLVGALLAEHLGGGGMAMLTTHQPMEVPGVEARTLRLG